MVGIPVNGLPLSTAVFLRPRGKALNIFVTATTTQDCAINLDDKRLFKQSLELVQMMATCVYLDKRTAILKSNNQPVLTVHESHPCTIWIRSSAANFSYAFQLAVHCLSEHAFRFNHDSLDYYELFPLLKQLKDFVTVDPKLTKPTNWPACVAEDLRTAYWNNLSQPERALDKVVPELHDAIVLYRAYMVKYKDLLASKYTRRQRPVWVNEPYLLRHIGAPPF